MRLLFIGYVFLLPFFSSPYLYSVFRSWSINYSLFPLFALLGLFFLRICVRGKLQLPIQGSKATTKLFGQFQVYSLIVTLVASLFLELSGFQTQDVYRSPIFNSVKEVLRAALTFIAFYIVVTLVRTEHNVWQFIRVLHVSLAVVIVYGYLQMIAIIFPDSLVHLLLDVITPIFDQGWQGESRDALLYIDSLKRVNLFTPEASTAALILEVYFLPLLFGSILSGVTAWQRNFLGLTWETILFFLILPLIVATLSSSGLLGLLVMVVFSLIFALKRKKALGTIGGLVIVSIGIIATLIYSLDVFDLVWYMITKVGDMSVGSTNTRYALLLASIDLFLNNPWGVGTNNNNVLMSHYVPIWGLSNPEIISSISRENLPTLNLGTEILTSAGLIGFIMLISVFIMIWRKIINYSARGVSSFAHYSFIFFIIAFLIHSFNSAATTFLWLWSILGLYTVMGNIMGNHKLNTTPRIGQLNKINMHT